MNDPFLDFYNRELTFVRAMGDDFAAAHPKVAARLRLDPNSTEDPHVTRLIDAFAFLTARIRLKIEDEFPEICQAMLEALYPQYLAPIPPVSICQFQLKEQALENAHGMVVARGSRLETDSVQGQPCKFRTCFRTPLHPLQVTRASYIRPPLNVPGAPWEADAKAAIRVELKCQSSNFTLDQIDLASLRFYLDGAKAFSNQLLEALLGDCLGVAVIGTTTRSVAYLAASQLSPVGFAEDESLVDPDSRVLSAYRLLWEFFAAPDKFRFVDLNLANAWKSVGNNASVELVFLLRRYQTLLEREFDVSSMRLGCTPVINLFHHRAEPIRLSEAKTEYRIIPSARSPQATEVYSIERVTAIQSNGEAQTFRPFFLPDHAGGSDGKTRFWHATRRPVLGDDAHGDRGTEMYITLVDLYGNPLQQENWSLDIELLCLNRDMVSRLPGGGKPFIKLMEGGASIASELIVPPTRTLRPGAIDDFRPPAEASSNDDIYWRLISHLALHHLTLTDTPSGKQTLQEILRLYCLTDDPKSRSAVESILQVAAERGVARVPSEYGAGFCRGLDIRLTLDEKRLEENMSYLFAMVLDHFFGLYANLNSFTRLQVFHEGKVIPIYRGRARMGSKVLM